MYEATFGFKKRPFAPAPRVDFYFPAATIEAARQALTRCIQRGEGSALVVGPSGSGKTLLCQVLAEHFRRSFQVVHLFSGRLENRRAVLQGIMHGLGKPYRGMDEEELRLALLDYLTDLESSEAVVLLVDEAHTLALRCLDELRMVTNTASDGEPRTRLVLVGDRTLEERLASPRLDSFSQRLTARCYLEVLTQTDTERYIRAQITVAGGATGIFPTEACHSVFQATGGVPRLINQVCDHALLLACAAGRRQIEAALVQEAWADLQQLPSPWNGEAGKPKTSTGTIEFGTLDDEPVQSPAATAQSVNDLVPAPAAIEPSVGGLDEAAGEPIQHVNEIQQLLGELEDDFRPAGTIGPEVEITLDDPLNPFSEHFEEEEVVVDRCAAALAQRNAQAIEAESLRRAADQPDRSAPETVPLRRQAHVVDLERDDDPEIVVEADYDFAERPKSHSAIPVRKHEYRQLFARLRHG